MGIIKLIACGRKALKLYDKIRRKALKLYEVRKLDRLILYNFK
jgi:hypothetical protein